MEGFASDNPSGGRSPLVEAPEEVIQRVKWSEVVGVSPTLSSHEEVDDMLERLGDHLHKLVDAEVKIILE